MGEKRENERRERRLESVIALQMRDDKFADDALLIHRVKQTIDSDLWTEIRRQPVSFCSVSPFPATAFVRGLWMFFTSITVQVEKEKKVLLLNWKKEKKKKNKVEDFTSELRSSECIAPQHHYNGNFFIYGEILTGGLEYREVFDGLDF